MAQRRKNLQISQTVLAKFLNISQSAYADYETGRSEPSLAMFDLLANVLDTKPAWIIFGIGEPEGEHEFIQVVSPLLKDLIEKDKKFARAAKKIREVLTEKAFYSDDDEFLFVLTQSAIRFVDEVYADNDDSFDWGVANVQYTIGYWIGQGLAQLRLAMLTSPDKTYLVKAKRIPARHLKES